MDKALHARHTLWFLQSELELLVVHADPTNIFPFLSTVILLLGTWLDSSDSSGDGFGEGHRVLDHLLLAISQNEVASRINMALVSLEMEAIDCVVACE